jgi:dimethylamine/trimethylamine dehydrogenase
VLGPDQLFAGQRPSGKRVVVFDDDHYYLGGVTAELLRQEGYDVSLVTPESQVSAWTANTFEVGKIQRRLIEAGIERVTETVLTSIGVGGVTLAEVYTAKAREVAADAVVLVTARLPRDELFTDLMVRKQAGEIATVRGIGDCWAPGTIAAAVWSGRRAAEEFDDPERDRDLVPFRREVTHLWPGGIG